MKCVRIYIYYDIKGYPFKIMPMFRAMEEGLPDFEHLIIDSGVNRFFKKERRKDYPKTYLEVYPIVAEKLSKKYGERIWITLPDYPSDYVENPIEGNMEKTLKNVELMIDRKVNWLVSIQAKWNDVDAFKEACKRYKDLIGDYPRIAIGTLCTNSRLDYAVKCCKLARRFFPDSWIHVFGPNIRWLRHITPFIDSIDSVAYWKVPWGVKGRFVENVRENWVRVWLDKAMKYQEFWHPQEVLKA